MSKINHIKAMLQNILAQFAKISTDKGLLSSSDDEFVVGSVIMIVDEEGNESKPEDGEYKSEDGTVYVIADGKITEIREPAEEKEPNEPEPAELKAQTSLFHRMAMAFESYEEKEKKIIDAIRALGIEAYLMEAGDDFAVVEYWTGEEYKLRKYAITWGEDGEPVIGESEEVKPAFVPVEEKPAEDPASEEKFEEEGEDKDAKIANLEAEIARLEEENGELKERIKELEEKPAAESAEEEFKKNIKPVSNTRLSKLVGVLTANKK